MDMSEVSAGTDKGSPLYPEGLTAFQNIQLRIHAELGKTSISIGEFLRLTPDSIVVFPVSEGEYISLFANDIQIARGEMIAVEGTIGIRITEINEEVG